MPPRTKEGDWRSYCNVLLVNGIILMPSYSGVDPALEEEARKTFSRLMPNWKIAPINSDTLIKKRGVLHCIGSTVPGYINALPLIGEAL
jgi:agmatine/peptidylarginine deiminase